MNPQREQAEKAMSRALEVEKTDPKLCAVLRQLARNLLRMECSPKGYHAAG